MSQRFRTAVAAFAIVSFVPISTIGQSRPAAAKTWKAPRTADNQPDLQGIWTNATITPLERPLDFAGKVFFTPPEAAAY